MLTEKDLENLIIDHELQSFSVNVLSVQRTLVEKLLSIVKDSHQDGPITHLSARIRHLYDIHQILTHDQHQQFLQSEEFSTLCAACIEDERQGHFKFADCLNMPLASAPIFSQFAEWKPKLEGVYRGIFSDLVYGDLPDFSDIEDTLSFLGSALR